MLHPKCAAPINGKAVASTHSPLNLTALPGVALVMRLAVAQG